MLKEIIPLLYMGLQQRIFIIAQLFPKKWVNCKHIHTIFNLQMVTYSYHTHTHARTRAHGTHGT